LTVRQTSLQLLLLLLVLVLVGVGAFCMRPISFFLTYSDLRLKMQGAESLFETVDGISVHYFALGPEDGPAVVLVHGLGGRAEDWRNLAPLLAKAGYRVFMPDLPGYGKSAKPADFSYSVPDEARVVVNFMDALHLQRVDLGGWSMGGWIVQEIAAAHPERIRKLLLFDSAGLNIRPDWNIALFTPQNAAELAQLDELLMPHPPRMPAFVARDILRISHEDAWVTQRALASMLTGTYTTNAILPTLSMPVLIVWGAEDHITPVSQGATIHNLIPQSRLDVIQGCGHLAPDQCAARIAPGVLNFLND